MLAHHVIALFKPTDVVPAVANVVEAMLLVTSNLMYEAEISYGNTNGCTKLELCPKLNTVLIVPTTTGIFS